MSYYFYINVTTTNPKFEILELGNIREVSMKSDITNPEIFHKVQKISIGYQNIMCPGRITYVMRLSPTISILSTNLLYNINKT